MTAGDSAARDVEVPASPLVDTTPLPFPALCARINDRIDAFLAEDDVSERLRSLQEQTRRSLDVIGEALEDYKYEASPCSSTRDAERATGYPSSLWPTMAAKTVSSS
jgi:hypothetical protein